MNHLKTWNFLPRILLIPGIAAALLRWQLYGTALDEKGLLTAGHPLSIAQWAVVALGAALIAAAVRKAAGDNSYALNFPVSPSAGSTCFLMAAMVLSMVLNTVLPLTGILPRIWKVLGILTAPALVWTGSRRSKGQTPFFAGHGLLCLFLLLYVISRYQLWSGNPQLQDYVFELLAMVALILFSYHHAAFEADMGSRRWLLGSGMAVLLLSPAAVLGSGAPGLYIAGLVWAACDLCPLTPPEKDEVIPGDPA
jgi:hypothetical protein